MNVMLISQCDKRALIETRRILDQFAERRGDRTWQTPITQAGLDTLKKLLRQTARKNTAVACHWIRGIDHSELLWVVGDSTQFNLQGAVPTNTTKRNILRRLDENNWHTGELIQLLADMAGLLHDLGKSIDAFQWRLLGKLEGKNLIRHEWVSLRLLQSFVGCDDDATWLARIASPAGSDKAAWLARLHEDHSSQANPSPFKSMAQAPLAQALGWLVVTHHRLPTLPFGETRPSSFLKGWLTEYLTAAWNEDTFNDSSKATPEALKPYWRFSGGLPVSSPEWHQRATRVSKRLQRYANTPLCKSVMNNAFVLHLARLSLMLADHHYSRLELDNQGFPNAERIKIKQPGKLIANTRSANGKREHNQTLDEHLVGVARHGAEVAQFLPRFEDHLPGLGKHGKLKKRAKAERFQWQNKAFDLASGVRVQSAQNGAFIVNMASTGCGKTLANARVMYALADPEKGMRCAFAMGLRTLTLQTGQAFRDMLSLGEDDLSVRVGGSASRALFEHYSEQAEASGSASRQDLMEEDTHIVFEGQLDRHPLLRRVVADEQIHKLLVAPLLVCTIDHLTPATESQRGGRQIAPMLRLMSGDLVLDEPDDFDLKDLPALTRLVHWAGLLGSRVLLSSATLPPALVQGLYESYRNGRIHFQTNRSEAPGADTVMPPVCCLWIDEFMQQHINCTNGNQFEQAHQTFVQARAKSLKKQASTPRRRVALIPLEGLPSDGTQACKIFAEKVMVSAGTLHSQHHSIDMFTKKRVSFGLVRMANVEQIVEVAQALFAQGAAHDQQVHLCVYHSRFPLLIRSAIERQLDATLKRHVPDAVFELPDIRARLDSSKLDDHLFIVLGSPVTEVGRDHDYDWAVVEPSSIRSLIQLLGRVRRHREGDCTKTNVHIFTTNLRHFRQPDKAAFCRPGFEEDTGAYHLETHDLRQLLSEVEQTVLDARPRIQAPPATQLQHTKSLSHLEHARMQACMLPQLISALPATGRLARSSPAISVITPLNASTWWHAAPSDVLLCGLIIQHQRFRDPAGQKDVDLALLPDDEGEQDRLHWVMKKQGGIRNEKTYLEVDLAMHLRLSDEVVKGEGIAPWGVVNYMEELTKLAESLGYNSLQRCAEKFGTVSVPEHERGWQSHPVLGFSKRR